MFPEIKNDNEKMLFGIPEAVTEFNLECNQAKNITGIIPTIEFSAKGYEILTDNISAPGFGGLLANKRVSETLREVGANNLQQFPVILKDVNGGGDCSDYDLINIIGDADIVDYEKSDITLRRPKKIKFIESLSFIDTSDMPLPYIFRLTSFLPLIIAHNRVKQAFEANNITGFTFYKPEEFSL